MENTDSAPKRNSGLESDLTDKVILLADMRDVKSLSKAVETLRLVVPDEKKQARRARQVVLRVKKPDMNRKEYAEKRRAVAENSIPELIDLLSSEDLRTRFFAEMCLRDATDT